MGPFLAEDLGLEEILIQGLFFRKISQYLACGKLVQKGFAGSQFGPDPISNERANPSPYLVTLPIAI
jgi:hypothetical protein